MKDVTLIGCLPPVKGISSYTKALVNALSKVVKIDFLGFNKIYPKFLYPGDIWDFDQKRLRDSEYLRIKNVLNWYNPFQWVLEALRIKTDKIHAQIWSYPLAPIYFVILGINKLRGKEIILTIHNVQPHEKSFIKKFLNRLPFYFGDKFIVHTKHDAKNLQEKFNKKPESIEVIPHGILSTPLVDMSRAEARDVLGIAQDDKVLLCFGGIREYKGLDTVFDALVSIKDSKLKLLIAGQCWDKNLWENYEQIIEKNELEDRVLVYKGFIPDIEVEKYYKASDIVLLPYKYFDAQSGVGAKTLPFGIPMIVSDSGGLSDFVNSDADFVFESGETKALAEKIQNLLNNEEIYKKGQKIVRENVDKFSWESIAKKTAEIYGFDNN